MLLVELSHFRSAELSHFQFSGTESILVYHLQDLVEPVTRVWLNDSQSPTTQTKTVGWLHSYNRIK